MDSAGTSRSTSEGDTRPDLTRIPSVDRVLEEPAIRALSERCDVPVVTNLVRAAIGDLREAIRGGEPMDGDREALVQRVVEDVGRRLEAALAVSLMMIAMAGAVIFVVKLVGGTGGDETARMTRV